MGNLRDLSKLTTEEIAYTAGLFDGEGTIIIAVEKVKPGNHRKYLAYRLSSAIVNTDLDIIYWLQKVWGGNTTCVSPTELTKTHKTVWRWYLSIIDTYTFLQKLLPYLIIKKEKAKLAIAFRNEHVQYSHNQTTSTRQRWEWYKEQISKS